MKTIRVLPVKSNLRFLHLENKDKKQKKHKKEKKDKKDKKDKKRKRDRIEEDSDKKQDPTKIITLKIAEKTTKSDTPKGNANKSE